MWMRARGVQRQRVAQIALKKRERSVCGGSQRMPWGRHSHTKSTPEESNASIKFRIQEKL